MVLRRHGTTSDRVVTCAEPHAAGFARVCRAGCSSCNLATALARGRPERHDVGRMVSSMTGHAARPAPGCTPMDSTRAIAGCSHQVREVLHWPASVRPVAPRPVIDASWQRMIRLGLSPEQSSGGVPLEREELEYRRRTSSLGEVDARPCGEGPDGWPRSRSQIMVVADAEGRVLWREGSASVLRQANGISLEEGAAWSEHADGDQRHRHGPGRGPSGPGPLRRALRPRPRGPGPAPRPRCTIRGTGGCSVSST